MQPFSGDNPLTACHVARELRFVKHKTALILSSKSDGSWVWESVNEDVSYPFDVIRDSQQWATIVSQSDLCLTGDALVHLQHVAGSVLPSLLPKVRVFARFDPKQKEFVITSLRDEGFTVLMCGDGTNDVGALKHANVGVAILSSPPVSEKKEPKKGLPDTKTVAGGKKLSKRPHASDGQEPSPPRLSRQQQKMQELLKEMEESERAQIVKLGDASIAAPFSK